MPDEMPPDMQARRVTVEFEDGSVEVHDFDDDPTGFVLAFGTGRELVYHHYWPKSGTVNFTIKTRKP